MIKNGRWRGRMPFRSNHRLLTETLEEQGRTGEPSLITSLNVHDRWFENARGRSKGSFTEHVRRELHDWLNGKGIPLGPITFEYKLFRHRIITVIMDMPRIYHHRTIGDGSKGFVLEGSVRSIDGARPYGFARHYPFALNRIVGHFKNDFLRLTAPKSEG